MIYFPNAKINLGLHILEKRQDAFHNIETVLYPISLSDVLEILPAKEFDFQLSGILVDGVKESNLCYQAYNLLKSDFNLPPIYMQLHKIIPLGAGLGGGSSDAAFVLKALNNLFNLKLNNEKLQHYASILGSDCGLFINNQPAIATGRGEILNQININLKGFWLILVKPQININTAIAYSNVKSKQPSKKLFDIIKMPVEFWKDYLVNDFEKSVFKQFPLIADIKSKLYDLGAVYAAMSGSGSTVFGLFKEQIEVGHQFEKYFVHNEIL